MYVGVCGVLLGMEWNALACSVRSWTWWTS